MGRELISQDIRTAVKAAVDMYDTYAGGDKLIVEYDNRIIVDTKTATKPFLQVRIKMIDSEQVALGDNTPVRYDGQIELAVAVKENGGAADAYRILDFIVPLLQRKALGSVRTYVAKAVTSRPHLGWVYYPTLVPYWSDQVS